MIKSVLGAIFVGMLLWFMQDYLRDVPTVTYSVSEPIEIPGALGTVEFAQEITVTNSGRSLVKSVSIQIPKHVLSYKLTKHSTAIKEIVDSGTTSFELIYPELPKGQKARLLVRYDSFALSKKGISISHVDGAAKPQDDQAPEINYTLLFLVYLFGIASQNISQTARWKREYFNKFANDEEIFRDDKPWFIASSEWSEIQYAAIDRTLNEFEYSLSEQHDYYRLLNRKKPALLSEDHWAALQKRAIGLLLARATSEITDYTNLNKLIDFLRLKKPEALPMESWVTVQSNLKNAIRAKLVSSSANAKTMITLLESTDSSLNAMPTTVANELRKYTQDRYFEYLMKESKYDIRNDPSTILSTARFDLLSESQSTQVKDQLRLLARMREMPSEWSLKSFQKITSHSCPAWMRQDEFDSLCKLVTEANALTNERSALLAQKLEVAGLQQETEKIKNQVLGQLHLIDRVITDPTSIDKIEVYESTFAPGNKRNLELVAQLLCGAHAPSAP